MSIPVGWTGTATIIGDYRYDLTRIWGDGPRLIGLGLNPSRADAKLPDPTIRKLCTYAVHWGFAGLIMLNLFAFRTPFPHEMMAAADPVGPRNDEIITRTIDDEIVRRRVPFAPVLCVWGNHGPPERVQAVLGLLTRCRLLCVGTNANGSPQHPARLRNNLDPVLWVPVTNPVPRRERAKSGTNVRRIGGPVSA